MRPFMVLCASASLAGAQVRVPVEFDKSPGWGLRPTFLSNPADGPEILASEGRVTLRVAEPGKGMKFELRLRPFDAASATYLLMRYKARELGGGYALWVYDGSSGGRMVLPTSKLKQDGQWHVAAIDLEASGVVGSVRSVLTEVQCREEPASITFDYLSDDVEPLVPTLCPTVYANRFASNGRVVWTLFNAQFRTFRGDCLRVPLRPGARYIDAFAGAAIEPMVERGKAVIRLELGPRGVGCIVALKE